MDDGVFKIKGISRRAAKIDHDLWVWYCETKSREVHLTKKILQAKAREVFKEAGINNFLASDGWYRRWKNRWQEKGTKTKGNVAEFNSEDKMLPQTSDNSLDNTLYEDISNPRKFEMIINSCLDNAVDITHGELPADEFEIQDELDFMMPSNQNQKDVDNFNRILNVLEIEMNEDEQHGCDLYHVFELLGSETSSMDCQKDNFVSDNNNSINSSIDKNKDGKTDLTPKEKPKPSKQNSTLLKNKKIKKYGIKKGQSYLPSFKQKVLEYAMSHSFKETALKFNVNCNTLTVWSREIKRLQHKNNSTSTMPDLLTNKTDDFTDIVGASQSKTEDVLLDIQCTKTGSKDKSELQMKFFSEIGEIMKTSTVAQSDELFLMWIKIKRSEQSALQREAVFGVAVYCLQLCSQAELKPAWFTNWVKRFEETVRGSKQEGGQKTEKYIMYPDTFKVEVALYAKAFTKNSAAKIFNVPRRRIFDWYNNLQTVNKCKDVRNMDEDMDNSFVNKNKYKIKKNNRRAHVEGELYCWYHKRVIQEATPTSHEIKAKAKELFDQNGLVNMKCSEGWLSKFCLRTNIKLRHNGDDDLLVWILTQFDNNVSLTHPKIAEKANELLGKRKTQEFKGSKGWIIRFLKRHSNFVQTVPTIYDKLPEIIQDKVDGFRCEVQSLIKSLNINLSCFGNMDEVPIYFNSLQEKKDSKLPLLRKTGFKNCQAVVILTVIANGQIIPPTIVFKGTALRNITIDNKSDITIIHHDENSVDYQVLSMWLREVWFKIVDTPNLLVIDSYDPHLNSALKDEFCIFKNNIAAIPEGCSSQLQPVNVSISQKFQEYIYDEWNQHNVAANLSHNIKCQCPSEEMILEWIRISYQKLLQDPISIINSFKLTQLI